MEMRDDETTPPVLRIVEPGETVEALAEAAGAHLLLTNQRLVVAAGAASRSTWVFRAFAGSSSTSNAIDRRRS